ncbi:MAG: LysE family transporter [Thermoanaerobaculia bacterium]|nr:LysE family transporter [Thermoanaerobaculia bacterium]
METALLGLSLGLAAGATPGPLLTLTVTASLERGFASGARFAVAPVFSDLPVLAICLLVLSEVPGRFLAVISGLGGLLLVALGIQTLAGAAGRAPLVKGGAVAADDLRKAILVNLLNPNPWLFWAAVGGPIFLAAWRRQPGEAAVFLAAFYLLLVGSKLAVAALVARGRHYLTEPWYRRVVGVCGALLVVLGGLLAARAATLWEGA